MENEDANTQEEQTVTDKLEQAEDLLNTVSNTTKNAIGIASRRRALEIALEARKFSGSAFTTTDVITDAEAIHDFLTRKD